jgi:hypothetical protein
VGRTVPSFRIAAEIERTKWNQFRSYLDKGERKMFHQMYEYFKSHSAACGNACKPVVIHPIIMSIIFQHYKQLTKLMDQKKAKDKAKSNTLDIWTQTEGG